MRTTRMFIAAGAAVALALAAPATASAAPKPTAQQVWSAQVGAPFSLAVSGQRVLVADGGPGVIGQLQPDGSIAPVVTGVPGLAGLAVRGAWMAYGSSVMDDSSEPPVISTSGLVVRDPHGATVYADVHAYEVATNPDLGNEYGAPCQAGGVTGGLIDSHVYAVAAYDGAWLVADAGANALFRVTDAGAISTVAVLPPVPLRLTVEAIGMLGLTTCEPGDVFYAEPVPTGHLQPARAGRGRRVRPARRLAGAALAGHDRADPRGGVPGLPAVEPHPPGMFLGDVGSHLLGGGLAATALACLAAGVHPLAAIAPLLVTGSTRWSPWPGGRCAASRCSPRTAPTPTSG